MEMILLDPPGLYCIARQQALDIGAHSLVDELEESGGRRIKTIVEVEDPVADVGEARVHGSSRGLSD